MIKPFASNGKSEGNKAVGFHHGIKGGWDVDVDVEGVTDPQDLIFEMNIFFLLFWY